MLFFQIQVRGWVLHNTGACLPLAGEPSHGFHRFLLNPSAAASWRLESTAINQKNRNQKLLAFSATLPARSSSASQDTTGRRLHVQRQKQTTPLTTMTKTALVALVSSCLLICFITELLLAVLSYASAFNYIWPGIFLVFPDASRLTCNRRCSALILLSHTLVFRASYFCFGSFAL